MVGKLLSLLLLAATLLVADVVAAGDPQSVQAVLTPSDQAGASRLLCPQLTRTQLGALEARMAQVANSSSFALFHEAVGTQEQALLEKLSPATKSFLCSVVARSLSVPAALPNTGPLPAAHDELLGVSNMLAMKADGDVQQAETDVFVAVLYAVFLLYVLRGMFAKLWCDNFFMQEREDWIAEGDEAGADHNKVDANYAKPNWELNVLDEMAKAMEELKSKNQKEAAKDKEKDKEAGGGVKNVAKDTLRWHHESEWPMEDGSDWSAPIDPFDTIREHHMPAVHYIRVYCQENHYSIGWRLMGLVNSVFKSSVEKMNTMKKRAKPEGGEE